MEKIKEAFQNVKKDMDSLKEEIDFLKQSIYDTQKQIKQLSEIFSNLNNSQQKNKINEEEFQNFNKKQNHQIPDNKPHQIPDNKPYEEKEPKKIKQEDFEKGFFNNMNKSSHNLSTHSSTHNLENSTNQHINSTDSTHSSTHFDRFKPLKDQNFSISTGNRGVPTDRQTNRQTNRQTQNQENFNKNKFEPIDDAAQILDSLDNLKKEVRIKFKRLTNQEFIIFSTLYQIEENLGYATYNQIAEKLGLSESSIRDYIGRIIKKEIPVEKIKVNNKNIQLTVSQNLKKVATLSTILKLRDI